VRTALRIRIPAPRRTKNPRLLHQAFIVASTKALKLLVYTANSAHGSADLRTTVVADLSPNSPSCVTNPDNSRSCSLSVGLPPPADDIVVSTWDQAPVASVAGETIPSTAKQLAAAAIVNHLVPVGQANVVSITLDAVIASIRLALPNPASGATLPQQNIHGTIPSKWTVGLNALDADGNLIVAGAFDDAAGNPETLQVTLGSPSPSCGSVSIATAGGSPGSILTFTQSPTTGVQFVYGATALAGLMTTYQPCIFLLSASAGTTVAERTIGFALLGPLITEFKLSNGVTPSQIASGPDGSIWYADNAHGIVGSFSPQTLQAGPLVSAVPAFAIAPGPAYSGQVWLAQQASVRIVATTGTAGTQYSAGITGPVNGIALGADGNQWFTDDGSNSIGQITPSGGVTEFTLVSASGGPSGITSGSDNALWFTESATKKIARIATNAAAGAHPAEYSQPAGLGAPAYITSGPDGALWYVTTPASIVRATANAVSPAFSSIAPQKVSGANLKGIAGGPDGAVWFTDAGNNAIGRVPTNATSTGQITEYALPTAGSLPAGITLGADANLWFAESSGKIARMSW
jgi:virginiamycin B lyase